MTPTVAVQGEALPVSKPGLPSSCLEALQVGGEVFEVVALTVAEVVTFPDVSVAFAVKA